MAGMQPLQPLAGTGKVNQAQLMTDGLEAVDRAICHRLIVQQSKARRRHRHCRDGAGPT